VSPGRAFSTPQDLCLRHGARLLVLGTLGWSGACATPMKGRDAGPGADAGSGDATVLETVAARGDDAALSDVAASDLARADGFVKDTTSRRL
jgi:hypothetical protein